MSKIVQVTYNAETLETTITVDGKSFDTSRIEGKKIEDWAYPFMMRKVRWDGFYDEIVSALDGEKEFDLVFEGSDEALAELKEAWEDAPVNVVCGYNNVNSVEISYDEKSLSVSITVNGEDFDTSRINGKEIEDWVYPFMMRKVKWGGIFEELSKAVGSNEYDIVFSGARNAMKALMEECPETVTISYQKSDSSDSKIVSTENNESNISVHNENVIYEHEKVVELRNAKKDKEAFEIACSAADNGDTLAQKDLAEMYEYGRGVERDINAALKLYLEASEQDASCMIKVAEIYSGQSNDLIKDPKKAEEWFKKAEACCSVEDFEKDFGWHSYVYFLKDEGREKEAFEALKHWAKLGITEALEHLGYAYYFGQENKYFGYSHIPENENEARSWFFKAAEKGSADGKLRMGEFYFYGEAGVHQNYSKAFQYFSEAVVINDELSNDELSLVHEMLGECYIDGLGINVNIKKAKKHFQKAADLDSPKAMYYLGNIYRDENNGSQSEQWLTKAAENGYSVAWAALGFMYLNGNSVKQNYQRAYELMKKAAKENCSLGEYGLGIMFDNGYHVQQDYVKANERYCNAMEMGNLNAQVDYALNCIYSLGITDREDYGFSLLEEAADNGNDYANEILAELIEEMSEIDEDEHSDEYYDSIGQNYNKQNTFSSKDNISKIKDFIQSDDAKAIFEGLKIGAKAGFDIYNGITTGNPEKVINSIKDIRDALSE